MLRTRVMPTLLIKGNGLYKGIQFKNHRYVGDPMNAIRIYATKEVDELVLLDIEARKNGKCIDPDIVQRVAKETMMPLTVGGGITTLDQAKALFNAGAEKVSLNSVAFDSPNLISEIANIYGNQSIVVSMDLKKNLFGKYQLYSESGLKKQKVNLVDHAKAMESLGAGELLVTSMDQEGTMQGFDIQLTSMISEAVSIPVIASGGAGSIEHMAQVVHDGHADAVAVGSFFVFHGKRRAVLINFPLQSELQKAFHPNERHSN